MNTIPVANISAFTSNGDGEARKAAAKELRDAVKAHGCAAITGHGLPEPVLKDAFATMRKLFDLPLEEKLRAPHPEDPMPHRGYLAISKERSGKLGAVYSSTESEREFLTKSIDWKETYDIGHEDNKEQENIWLPDDAMPGFRPYMVKLYEQLTAVSMAVLEGLMMGMDLNEEECQTLRQMHAPVEHQMRLAHYLPMTVDDRNDPTKIRLAAHKDFSSYTLLFQEGESGLEFQNRETGEYMAATLQEGTLYLNIAEFMERFSNGLYRSAMHRVAIRPVQNGEKTIPGRYSIPYFNLISSAAAVQPMPSRVQADGKANYESVKFQELAVNVMKTLIPGTGDK